MPRARDAVHVEIAAHRGMLAEAMRLRRPLLRFHDADDPTHVILALPLTTPQGASGGLLLVKPLADLREGRP